jgi:hypothetical protein
MYVYYPTAVGANIGNTYITLHDDPDRHRYCEWLYNPDKMVEIDAPELSYFKEFRRKTFSDVCHARPDGANKASRAIVSMQDGRYIYTPFLDEHEQYVGTGLQFVKHHHIELRDDFFRSGKPYYLFTTVSAWRPYGESIRITLNVSGNLFDKVERDSWVGYNFIYSRKLSIAATFEVDTRNRKVGREDLSVSDGFLPADEQVTIKDTLFAIIQSFPDDPDLSEFSVYEAMVADLRSVAESLHLRIRDFVESAKVRSFARVERIPQYVIPMGERQDFLLHEPGVILDHEDDLFYGRGTEKYFRNTLIQAAYADLVDNVPKMNDNNISNLLDISKFISDLVIRKKVEIPSSLSDAWLSYRYQYQTTKSDVEEAIAFMSRKRDLNDIKSFKCYGTSTITYKGVKIRCICSANVAEKHAAQVKKVWNALITYGLAPDFYVIWDMVPYSFIVDWFLPIGDILSRWDANRQVKQHYDIKDVNFSLSYRKRKGIYSVKCYSRWLSGAPPELQGRYTFERQASDETLVKRVLDGAALIIG